MASKADIGNLALGRLKISKTIADLDEQSTAARVINQFYDQCRQEVLRAFPWGCASRPVQLAQVSGQTYPGWVYVYQYPDDCLMVRCVADEGGMRQASRFVTRNSWQDDFDTMTHRMPWQVALKDDNASKVLLSDVADAWAFMTADLENSGVFTPDLVSTIAWKLAAEAGGPLQAESSAIDRAEQRYYSALQTASAQSFNESRDDVKPDSPSISCRY